ncbi:MAG: alpha/beta hydrolase family protein, partial [Anaerolineae bacterium]
MKPRLAFAGTSAGDFAAWRSRFAAAYTSFLGPWPEPVPANVEVTEDEDCGDHRRLKLYYDSSPGITVPAYLLVPKGIAPGERRPGIIACHGHGNGKDDIVGIDGGNAERTALIQQLNYDYARQAVRRGYVVIAPDWLPFGERKPPVEWSRVGRDPCNVVGMAWQYYGYTLLAQNVWDGMRAVDILAERPEVDGSRLAVLGLSYGGTMTTHLAINDPRLKVAVISGYISTVRGDAMTMRGKGNFCGAQHVPQLLAYGDVPEMAGLIAPKPLLVEAGLNDDCFEIGDARRAFGRLEAMYTAAGCADRLGREEFPGGHAWRGVAAWDWLARWL